MPYNISLFVRDGVVFKYIGNYQFQQKLWEPNFWWYAILGILIFNWVILLITSYGVLSLQRYVNVFFMNSLVPMRFHLWRRPHDSPNFTFVDSWLSFLVAVIDVSLWWHGKVEIISVLFVLPGWKRHVSYLS